MDHLYELILENYANYHSFNLSLHCYIIKSQNNKSYSKKWRFLDRNCECIELRSSGLFAWWLILDKAIKDITFHDTSSCAFFFAKMHFFMQWWLLGKAKLSLCVSSHHAKLFARFVLQIYVLSNSHTVSLETCQHRI